MLAWWLLPRQQLLQLLLLEVQEGLDTALKIRADRNPSQRNLAIRAALDSTETLLDSELGPGATEELLLARKGAEFRGWQQRWQRG